MLQPLQLTPQYRDYVWGGQRLRPGQRTAEAWVIYEDDQVASGPLAGKTLAEVAAQFGSDLLGQPVVNQTGSRFPLLVKLLDCADWLSLQVHPNDEQARRLEGPHHFGKTEAWHVLDAASNAELLFGLRPHTTPDQLAAAVRSGQVLDLVQRHTVQPGDTVFIRPGMIHALGPGLFIYEVQQTSNITYRVYDWDRPAAAGRQLHIDQSLAVLDPHAEANVLPRPSLAESARETLVTCPYFTLDLLSSQSAPISLDTHNESFHALTLISGKALVQAEDWQFSLEPYQSLVIPACQRAYQIIPQAGLYLLKSSVNSAQS